MSLQSPNTTRLRTISLFAFIVLSMLFLFILSMLYGQTEISCYDLISIILGDKIDAITEAIIMEARLPMSITAVLAGIGLSSAGLVMQTVFRNPLAGPSLLGVSSGASLGVAIVMMGTSIGIAIDYEDYGIWIQSLVGAISGAMMIIIVLSIFSTIVRNGVMLLIIGVLLSYLSSSLISMLNYFSEADQLKNFTVWGLGSYAGVTYGQLPIFTLLTVIGCVLTILCAKPLNGLLLGERYATSLGYSVKRIRTMLLLLSGFLTAIVTAYCGPIGFIGLIVPHLARLLFRSSNHIIILPASILIGAAISLLCTLLSTCAISDTLLPINVVTPLLGIPIILYLIVRRNSIPYFK